MDPYRWVRLKYYEGSESISHSKPQTALMGTDPVHQMMVTFATSSSHFAWLFLGAAVVIRVF